MEGLLNEVLGVEDDNKLLEEEETKSGVSDEEAGADKETDEEDSDNEEENSSDDQEDDQSDDESDDDDDDDQEPEKDDPDDGSEGEESEEEKEEEPELIEELVALVKENEIEGEFKSNAELISALKADLQYKNDYIEKAEKFNGEMLKIFDAEPSIKDFMIAINDGIDPKVAAEIYILENLDPEEGEKNIDAYKARRKQLEKEAEDREEQRKEFEKNSRKSSETAEKFMKDNKLSQKWMQDALNEINDEITGINKGVVSEKFLSMIVKAKNYEKDLKKADEVGYLRGKNEKIKLVKSKKSEGDGMPSLKPSLKVAEETPEVNKGLLDMALDDIFGGR